MDLNNVNSPLFCGCSGNRAVFIWFQAGSVTTKPSVTYPTHHNPFDVFCLPHPFKINFITYYCVLKV